MDQSYASQLSPSPGRSPLSRKVRYQETSRMISQDSLHPPSFARSVSQDSLDSNAMEDYWSEVKSIEEDCDSAQEEVIEVRSADEGELEEAWLQEAGLSTLVSGPPGDSPAEALVSTLTRTQAAMVKKRLDNYTQTMRKKNKQPARDVRDIFASGDTPVSEACPEQETRKCSISVNNDIYIVERISTYLPQILGTSETSCCEDGDTFSYKYGVIKSGLIQIIPSINLLKIPARISPHKHLFKVENCVSDCQMSKERPAEEFVFTVPYSEGAACRRKDRDSKNFQRIKKDDGTLPKFVWRSTRLGFTRVGDLSPEDMKKIGYLSLIELTAFYDALGIELKRNRTVRIKVRESGLFGVPLTTLLENDQKKVPGLKVPLLFKKLLSKLEQTGLQTEGILRVPGSASRVKHLRRELEEKFYDDVFDWDQVRHNDAAGLLKMFIRDLPYPLLTMQYLPTFTAVENISPSRTQLQALHLLIMLLPEPNRDTLKALLEFLRKVVANEEKNRMSLWNVSMIVAPNLFMYRGKTAKPQEMQGAAGAAHLVRLLIKYQDLLWIVPCFMVSQVRKMNEAAMPKRHQGSEKNKKKLLRRWNAERDKSERSEMKVSELSGLCQQLSDIREGVIRVHAPLHAKVSMAIQLDSGTKAKDVMARFECDKRSARSYRYYSFCRSIGERCLDPDTYLLDLYRVNPSCDWVFKP
uniref:Rho GTPase activating protein 28 n=1 Tax=Lepisosteus oculatus TaxID=7918 RepID=W5M568_LEPOC